MKSKYWTVQDEIQKRVNKESDWEWAQNHKDWEIVQVEIKKIKEGAGLWNLARQILP